MERFLVSSHDDKMPAGVRLLAAMMGAGALLAMGALTAAGVSASESSPEPTFGETSTQTTAPATLETPFATPPITSTAAEG